MLQKRTMVTTVAVVIAVLAACVYRASEGQQSAAPTALKIGVVDVAKVLKTCQEYQDREKLSQEKARKLKSELDEMATKAQGIREELENALQPGSKEYAERTAEWIDLRALYEARKEGRVLALENQAWSESLYQKMLDEVARVARAEGISLVLAKDSSNMQPRSMPQVLYSSPTLELMTAAVLENLDKAYDASKAAEINKQ